MSNIGPMLRHLDLDFARLELAVEQQLLELLARALVALHRRGAVGLVLHRAVAPDDEHARRAAALARRGSRADRRRRGRGLRFGRHREQQVEQPLVDPLVREVLDFGLALGAHHVDRALDEVAHHRLDVAADVADLGELRRLDLHERRAGELREPARDLGLPDAGRADEDDVVGRDLVADRFRRALAAPPVAQRDGDRLLRVALPDDVAIELGDDLARREVGETGDALLRAIAGHSGGTREVDADALWLRAL